MRRAALPGLLRLPARGWRALGLPGRLAISALALALVARAALLVPPALDNASENRVNERRAQAANLERAVSADAAGRVRRGTLDGPLGPTTCEPVNRSHVDPRAPVFTCLVEHGLRDEYPSRRGRPSRAACAPGARADQRVPLPRARGAGRRPGGLVQ